jgi:hypothetical protein
VKVGGIEPHTGADTYRNNFTLSVFENQLSWVQLETTHKHFERTKYLNFLLNFIHSFNHQKYVPFEEELLCFILLFPFAPLISECERHYPIFIEERLSLD